MPQHQKYQLLSDRLVYEVAHLYIEKNCGASEIDRQLEHKFEFEWQDSRLTKESIVHIVREAISRGWITVHAPLDGNLAHQLKLKFDDIITDDKDVQVVNVGLLDASTNERDRSTSRFDKDRRTRIDELADYHSGTTERPAISLTQQVARVAAAVVLNLIKEVAAAKSGKEPVRIGLGAGYTAKCVIRTLGELLRHEKLGSSLAIHALTPGFSLNPLEAPVTYFRFFEGVKAEIEYFGLFTTPFVTPKGFTGLKTEPEIARAFKLAKELDIVVTSVGNAEDSDSVLGRYLSETARAGELERMKKAGWKGDVQFMPYSDHSSLSLRHARPVTLLDLDDLRAMRRRVNEKKFVVLCAAPCRRCKMLKTNALLPLLTSNRLDVWTHLICDLDTGRECLAAPKKPALVRAARR